MNRFFIVLFAVAGLSLVGCKSTPANDSELESSPATRSGPPEEVHAKLIAILQEGGYTAKKGVITAKAHCISGITTTCKAVDTPEEGEVNQFELYKIITQFGARFAFGKTSQGMVDIECKTKTKKCQVEVKYGPRTEN